MFRNYLLRMLELNGKKLYSNIILFSDSCIYVINIFESKSKKKHKGLGSMSFMKPERFKSPQLECQDSSLFDFEAAPKAYAPMQYESANVDI